MSTPRIAGHWWPVLALLLFACSSEPGTSLDVPFDVQAMSFANSSWSPPAPLPSPVNLPTANDQGPALSADGLSLYFCSNRPGGSGGNDLWASRRASEDEPWSAPVNLGTVVNSSAGDCGPSLSQDGQLLFFTSNRGGVPNDIFMATRADPSDDLAWSAPVRLGPEINTAGFEFSPFVTRWYDDGSAELYFDRGPSNAATDIYVVTIDAHGSALGPASLVAEVSSDANDMRATVRFDGREMLLSSNRGGRAGNSDLFVATRRSRNDRWSEPVPAAELNASPMHEIHPYLSKDGRTVVFVRGSGTANDIWVAHRTPSGDWRD